MARRPARLGPKRLVISDRARADIEEQVAYIAETDDLARAVQFAEHVDAELARLAAIGHSGVSREWLSPGLRLHVIGRHSVYFRVTRTETRIVRMLRGARNIESIDFESDR